MKRILLILTVTAAMMLAACGVPRAAGTLAAQYAASATTLPQDDAAVRQQLAAEDAAWTNLSQLLRQHAFGGITGVDPGFVQLIDQTAALAKRQHELITENQDDPALNRQALQRFNGLWQSTNTYLNQ